MDSKDNVTATQGKTRGTRGAKNRQHLCTDDPNWETKPGSSSQQDGAISSRSTRADSQRGDLDFLISLAGGIVSQLIKDAEGQLAEADACIEWYENKRREAEERLEFLRSLQNQDG